MLIFSPYQNNFIQNDDDSIFLSNNNNKKNTKKIHFYTITLNRFMDQSFGIVVVVDDDDNDYWWVLNTNHKIKRVYSAKKEEEDNLNIKVLNNIYEMANDNDDMK
ncbi:hypothetical protein DERP_006712 [Dermatophagoides pteronyssinus]|uniref:Uncharacterized protein n=1 Tax=Dermatophagoides pteronyssinus TaxID=6956 RepID=A0ABQ8IS15_DERPT|nr:hypothetical protein DERP_006712 [Dermatophagoides pteronyssinus]